MMPACSVTRIRLRSLPGRSFPPYQLRYVPTPASSSTRLVAGDVQLACCTRWGKPIVVPAASGEVVDEPLPMQLTQTDVSSQKTPILLREVACHVSLRPSAFHVPSPVARRVRSGSYVHAAGLPAFLL